MSTLNTRFFTFFRYRKSLITKGLGPGA